MTERNAEVPRDKRIELRIGINVGDIIIDGDDIFATSPEPKVRNLPTRDSGAPP
jgi:adenylate cyclase